MFYPPAMSDQDRATAGWYKITLMYSREHTDKTAIIDACRRCDHPDAKWLLQNYDNVDMSNEPVALYLKYFSTKDSGFVEEAAALGYPLAVATVETSPEGWHRDALLGIPCSLYLWAKRTNNKDMMRRAAQLGPMYACTTYADDYVTNLSIEWFHWLMQPVINFSMIPILLNEVIEHVPLECAFYVGYLVHRHPVAMSDALFTNTDAYKAKQDAVNGYAAYYLKELEATHQRINTWLLCARRLRVVHDIRRVIGTALWNDRGKL